MSSLDLFMLEREIARYEKSAAQKLGRVRQFVETKMEEARAMAEAGDCRAAYIKSVSLTAAIRNSKRLDPALKGYALKLVQEYYDEYVKPYCTPAGGGAST